MNTKHDKALYICPCCETLWQCHEVSEEMEDKQGCPDCLKKCERCGMVKDFYGMLEHCL